MGKSNFNNPDAPISNLETDSEDLGKYIFIDEYGNVTQIPKVKKTLEQYYPNNPSNVDELLVDVEVIGVTDTIAMGVGDNVMAYSKMPNV